MPLTRKHALMLLVPALALVSGTAGFLVARHAGAPPPAIEGLLWPDPPGVPSFEAMDQDGAAIDTASLRGRWSLLFFGFTHCPDVCPNTLTVLAGARESLAMATAGTPVSVVFVSVDPGRDGKEVLGPYVRYFDPAFTAIGGPGAVVLAQRMGVAVAMGKAQADGSYNVDHSASVFVVDPEGRHVGVIPAPHTVASLTRRFAAIVDFLRAHGS